MKLLRTKEYKKLPGYLWVITTFYNPLNLKSKQKNYNFFKSRLRKQGVNLLTVECAFNKQDFCLKKEVDADILIQVRSSSVMWQKERLLNVALKYLPKNCDKIAWLDADIIFLDDNWASKASYFLQNHEIVKPFSQAIRLSKLESKLVLNNKIDNIKLSSDKLVNYYSIFDKDKTRYLAVLGTCARREVFDNCGFYDKMILYGADKVLASSFLKKDYINNNLPPVLLEDIKKWQRNFSLKHPRINIHYLNGTVYHLFHGALKYKKYNEMNKPLHQYNFNPQRDLKINKEGCFEWGSDKTDFHNYLIQYFHNRNEDDNFLKNIIIFLIEFKKNISLFFNKVVNFIKKIKSNY